MESRVVMTSKSLVAHCPVWPAGSIQLAWCGHMRRKIKNMQQYDNCFVLFQCSIYFILLNMKLSWSSLTTHRTYQHSVHGSRMKMCDFQPTSRYFAENTQLLHDSDDINTSLFLFKLLPFVVCNFIVLLVTISKSNVHWHYRFVASSL